MKLVVRSFNNLRIPMVELIEGSDELYCSGQTLCKTLGMKEDELRAIYTDRFDEFDSIDAKDKETGVAHYEMKWDTGGLWSVDDMLTFALLSRSAKSKEFRKRVLEDVSSKASISR